jgi:hypothetical protein
MESEKTLLADEESIDKGATDEELTAERFCERSITR